MASTIRDVRIYVASAMVGDLVPLLGTGAFAGVVTTPSLLQRAGVLRDDVPHLVEELVGAGAREVCVPARARDPEALLREARRVAAVHPEVTVAVPATRGGLAAAAAMVREGRPVLVSALHRPAQLLGAVHTGCRWVAPTVAGIDDSGVDGVAEVLRMQVLLDRGRRGDRAERGASPGTHLLAADVRQEERLLALAEAGVAAASVDPDLAAALLHDDRTSALVDAMERVPDLP